MESQVDAPSSGVSLLEFLQIIKRRRIVIAQAFIVVACASTLITLFSRPVYQAEARLLVDQPSNNVSSVDSSNPISGLLQVTQPQSVDTQVEVLHSPQLMRRVSNESHVPISAFKVDEVNDTSVIVASAESSSPTQAANAANLLLEDYINQDIDRSLGKIRSTQAFVEQRSAVVQRQLNNCEARIEAFKQKYRVSDLPAERQQQIAHVSGLEGTLEQETAQLDSVTSQVEADQTLLKQQIPYLTTKPQAANPNIISTEDRLSDLLVQRSSLLQPGGFGPRAPAVKQIDGQITALRQRLRNMPALITSEAVTVNPEVSRLTDQITDLQGQQAGLRTQVARTRQLYDVDRSSVGSYAGWELHLNRLERQHDLLVTQFTAFQTQLANLAVRAEAHSPPATIIENAEPPTIPVRPKRLLDIILGCLFGLFVGLAFGLLQEYLDDRINSQDDAERQLQVSTLGRVPLIKGGIPQMGTLEGFGPAAESYRILRTNINFAAIDAPLKTLVVTSTSPGEGKSTTALNLSIAMALDGRRVALVDTDMRRPTLHKLVGIPSVPGLTDVLVGQVDLEDVLIENTDVPNLVAITCGSIPPNPSELLGSHRFQALVEQLKARFDIVIFDTPPVLLAADAPVLASQMDGTLLVIEVGGTKNAAARRTLETLRRGRTNLLGICLNKLNIPTDAYSYYHASPTELIENDLPRLDLLEVGAAPHSHDDNGSNAKGHD